MQLSTQLKDSIQTIGLWATVLVVLIHYRSADSNGGSNGLFQEWLLNAIARVAVPIFAYVAGLLYFHSADGTFRGYVHKLGSRIRTIAIPYLIVSLFGFATWIIFRWIAGESLQWSFSGCLSRIVLHPMGEQLWFLRDLMLLVVAAPLIGISVRHWPWGIVAILLISWFFEYQPMPKVAGWYLVNIEMLTFFSLGCLATRHIAMLEKVIRLTSSQAILCLGAWIALTVMRVIIDPNFDSWNVANYTIQSLLLHKISILAGMIALMSATQWILADRYRWLSGCSFFVYLFHEFPLREVLKRIATRFVSADHTFYLTAPAALVTCFALAHLMNRWTPGTLRFITGGRTPQRAASLQDRHRQLNVTK